jgi:CRP-like cAMP-binding protein
MQRLHEEPTVLSPGGERPKPDSSTPDPSDTAAPVARTVSSAGELVSASRAVRVSTRPELTHGSNPPILGETERFAQRDLLGTGGMGWVVRAFDKHLQREVAIKVLSPDGPARDIDIERFTEEARITGQLEHPNIVPVYEFGCDARGSRFLCMKLVQGETLDELLAGMGDSRLTTPHLADLLQIFTKVCDAVSFAHSRGVIHRDLKPSNVMVSDFGQVYVLDWGVARASTRGPGSAPEGSGGVPSSQGAPEPDPPGALIGTPSYMAPEQLRGSHDEVDERTDVFALGATLYQTLCGQPPRISCPPMLQRDLNVKIPAPQSLVPGVTVPAELSRIALKAMAHDPAERYATVEELKSEVESFQRGSWHLPRRSFAAGELIVREGDEGESAYIIVEGGCLAFRTDGENEVALRHMQHGDVFGETAIFAKKPRSASVRAITDVVVLEVTSDVLSSSLGLRSWMGIFVKALADRFREVDERLRKIESEGRSSARTAG